jgi:hypothetical protein
LRFRVCLLSPMSSEIRRGLPADRNGKKQNNNEAESSHGHGPLSQNPASE